MHKRYTDNECLVCLEDKMGKADLFRMIWDSDPLCVQCRERFKNVNRTLLVDDTECEVLYEYDEYFKTLLLQYKELYDEALAPIFMYPYVRHIEKKYAGYAITYVPSTEEKMNERGFNHLKKMFDDINLPKIDLFEKSEGPSQKKSNYQDRQKVARHIKLRKEIKTDMPLLLVDDVLTTGASIRACLKLIRKMNVSCKVLVISCNQRYLER